MLGTFSAIQHPHVGPSVFYSTLIWDKVLAKDAVCHAVTAWNVLMLVAFILAEASGNLQWL